MSRILAIDVGTSAVKAAHVDGGEIVAITEVALELSSPRAGWAEQDPHDWWTATVAAVANLRDRAGVPAPDAISVTGQMQDLVTLGADGEPTGAAILYSDVRATAEHDALVHSLDANRWAHAIGAPPDPTNVAAKWRWITLHQPDRAARTTMSLFGAHSYVVWRATGLARCDRTTAATTGFYDLGGGTWWVPVVEHDGIAVPDLVETAEIAGWLDPGPAAELGLPAGTPVVHANGDAVATTLGVVGRAVGRPYAYLGTSGWVAVGSPARPDASGVIALPGLDRDHWVAAAPMPTAGGALDWARTTLLGLDDPADHDTLAGDVCAAEHGVLFLPHLDGARLPVPAPEAAGVLLGARRSTDRATVAAATIEGVAHAVRQLLELVAPTATELAVCGGAARSPVVRRALADVTGRPVTHLAADHAAVLGAAIAATTALGGSAAPPSPLDELIAPRRDRAEIHRRAANAFDQIVPTMAPLLSHLVDIRASGPTDPSPATPAGA